MNFRFISRCSGFLILASMACLTVRPAVAEEAPKHRVLILSGANNHAWRETTPAIRAALEASGRFQVDVEENVAGMKPDAFAPYQVILSDGSSWLKQGNPVENDRPKSTTLAGDWIDNSGLNVKISQNPGDTQKWTFQPEPEPEPGSGVLWTVGDATWDQAATQATSPILNSFQGSVMFHDKKNGSKFQQILSFCVKNDLNTMIFGNGVRWTRKP